MCMLIKINHSHRKQTEKGFGKQGVGKASRRHWPMHWGGKGGHGGSIGKARDGGIGKSSGRPRNAQGRYWERKGRLWENIGKAL
jgi:hypothetical protein